MNQPIMWRFPLSRTRTAQVWIDGDPKLTAKEVALFSKNMALVSDVLADAIAGEVTVAATPETTSEPAAEHIHEPDVEPVATPRGGE